MPSFGRRLDGPTGRRAAARDPVVLAASALTLDSSRSVVVTDVSSAGAKLQGRDLPEAGADVLLKVGLVDVLATVAWSARLECGVNFEEPLDAESVVHLKREGKWARVMGVP